jgi:membrane-associated phospholipid phosphatase
MSGQAFTAEAFPGARRSERAPHASAGAALSLAVGIVIAMFLLWAVAEHVYAFEVRDTALLHDFTRLNRGAVGPISRTLLLALNPVLFTIWGIGLVLVALARERPRVAIAVVAVMSLAPLSSELLKPLLAHPHVVLNWTHVGAASWPSGHETAATALALSIVLVTPPRHRRLAAVVAVTLVLIIGAALLIREWHLPSDVLGGMLMGSLWAALAVAGVRASEARWPRRGSDGDSAASASTSIRA